MKRNLTAILALLIFVGFGCKHHPVYNGELITESSCDPQTVYFQNTILPLLTSNCAMTGCHNSTSHAEGIDLSTYAGIMNSGEGQLVSPYDPNGSKLYEVILNGEMPPSPYSNLSPSEIQLIYNWINQGALNNYCADCDTSIFTFSMAINPIITSRCSGCHGTVNPSGMTTILNYADVKALADNGKLYGVITGTGYPIMPPSVGLPDCEKTKILKWINNGAPNN